MQVRSPMLHPQPSHTLEFATSRCNVAIHQIDTLRYVTTPCACPYQVTFQVLVAMPMHVRAQLLHTRTATALS
eukprot:2304357-Amphidinium_carterae.1